jgi:hypothetical protein
MRARSPVHFRICHRTTHDLSNILCSSLSLSPEASGSGMREAKHYALLANGQCVRRAPVTSKQPDRTYTVSGALTPPSIFSADRRLSEGGSRPLDTCRTLSFCLNRRRRGVWKCSPVPVGAGAGRRNTRRRSLLRGWGVCQRRCQTAWVDAAAVVWVASRRTAAIRRGK